MLTKRNNAMRRTRRKKNQDGSTKTKKVMMKFAAMHASGDTQRRVVVHEFDWGNRVRSNALFHPIF